MNRIVLTIETDDDDVLAVALKPIRDIAVAISDADSKEHPVTVSMVVDRDAARDRPRRPGRWLPRLPWRLYRPGYVPHREQPRQPPPPPPRRP